MPALLEPAVRAAVDRLGGTLATTVARHLAAAGLALQEDPQRALAHAQAAKSRAPRLAETREVLGVAAYAAGDYGLARSELRAARRMTGAVDLLPLLADCERALGHPHGALALAAEPAARRLRGGDRIELAIVVAGARRDLGQPEAAVAALELPGEAHPAADGPGAAGEARLRLWYAYADALEAAGRSSDARRYFTQVLHADDDGLTDAAARLAALQA